jgi:hypothetical protein
MNARHARIPRRISNFSARITSPPGHLKLLDMVMVERN